MDNSGQAENLPSFSNPGNGKTASTEATPKKSLFVMVGDISAERHTAKVLAVLKQMNPNISVWGCGGNAMQEEGAEILRQCEEFTFVGVAGPKQIKFFSKLNTDLTEEIGRRRPDGVLLVDMGTFNLMLAKSIKKHFPDLPILYFISPQVWASREGRIQTMAKVLRKVLVIFPFEEKLYLERGLQAKFVGHPILSSVPCKEDLRPKKEFCQQHQLDSDKPIIGVFAGSRRQEVAQFTSAIMQAVKQLHREDNDLQFLFSMSDEKLGTMLKSFMKKAKLEDLVGKNVFFLDSKENHDLMNVSDLLWTKSGTTTLEATLLGKPMIVFYKGPWFSYALVCLFKRVKRISWPNLLAGELLVPELIQLDCRAQQLVRYTRDLLAVPALRAEISERLLKLKAQLGQGDYATNVASEIVALISARTEAASSTSIRT